MAVEVKLLLRENITCGVSSYGAHQPSATTVPWRRIITLCSASIFASAASRKALMAGEGMPWASGALRGRARGGAVVGTERGQAGQQGESDESGDHGTGFPSRPVGSVHPAYGNA